MGFKFKITRWGHFCISLRFFVELKGTAELVFEANPQTCVYVFRAYTGSTRKSVQWSSEERLREVC